MLVIYLNTYIAYYINLKDRKQFNWKILSLKVGLHLEEFSHTPKCFLIYFQSDKKQSDIKKCSRNTKKLLFISGML